MEKLADEARKDQLNNAYTLTMHQYVAFLRGKKNCKHRQFKGTEYSYNQTTKKKTETELRLMLYVDRLEYKVEKQSANLTKLQ